MQQTAAPPAAGRVDSLEQVHAHNLLYEATKLRAWHPFLLLVLPAPAATATTPAPAAITTTTTVATATKASPKATTSTVSHVACTNTAQAVSLQHAVMAAA
jgi:hypothetical protein